MDQLVLKQIQLKETPMGTKVLYDYDAPAVLTHYIKGAPLYVEFPGDVRTVPQSILAIPFVGAMLTVCMLLDIKIQVHSLDAVFVTV